MKDSEGMLSKRVSILILTKNRERREPDECSDRGEHQLRQSDELVWIRRRVKIVFAKCLMETSTSEIPSFLDIDLRGRPFDRI